MYVIYRTGKKNDRNIEQYPVTLAVTQLGKINPGRQPNIYANITLNSLDAE